jgi:ribosomal protein S27E
MPLAHATDTLEYLDHNGHPLWATCAKCQNSTLLNVKVLGQTMGWKTKFMDLEARLRCARCGSRQATISLVKPVFRCPTCGRPIESYGLGGGPNAQ